MALDKEILKAAGDKTKLISKITEALEKTVAASQREMLQRFVDEWLDKLDKDEDGNVKATLKNKRMLQNIDAVFDRFVENEGLAIAKEIADGVDKIVNFNGRYFRTFTEEAQLIPIQKNVTEFVKSWLGLKGNGQLEGNGYLHKLINNGQIRNEIKNLALKGVVTQRGYNALKASLKDTIVGNPDKLGALQKYYRNFAYDTISQVDRATGLLYADGLQLNHAIYEGGVIETSRKWCIEHNGKVYTRDEISKMNPKTAIPDPYDPFTDMGGFGCRHHWNWIPKAVAYALRPELRELDKAA